MMKKNMVLILGLFLILAQNQHSVPLEDILIPLTGVMDGDHQSDTMMVDEEDISELINNDRFIENSGETNRIIINNQLSFLLQEQPKNQNGFVSSDPTSLTRFSMPERFGAYGILAHNYLAGNHFFELELDDEILILQDGSRKAFRISQKHEFQALNPHSIHSDFLDLETGEKLNVNQLFLKMYGEEGYLTLQTCIEKDGNYEWGRLFLIAEPVELL